MQSRNSRVALLVAAALVAVAAFVVLSPDDDDEPAGTTAGERQSAAGDAETGGSPNEGAPKRPAAPVIEIEDGQLQGGVERIEVEKGETIRFQVRSDAPDEIHVHGYELTKPVRPGRSTTFRFPADLEGVYEVEAHEIGDVPIAELRVSP